MSDTPGLARVGEEPVRVYEAMRSLFTGVPKRKKKKAPAEDVAFTPGRDPLSLSEAFRDMTGTLGWDPALAEAKLFVDWPFIVGEGVAEHAYPVEVTSGRLVIQASSSAWATQLRLMRHELLVVLAEKLPEVPIDTLTVLAPGAPSWKSGPRSVPGRGPRDTYG
jgi:predicted nucleic acid-binding Zn ribbon protein